jgi:hypothetical protein
MALGLDSEEIEDRLARLAARAFSRVRISARAMTEYKICTTDPQGDESDTWATLTATFLQRFRITGGRIVRGEEIVQVGVTECPDAEQNHLAGRGSGDEGEETLMSPNTARRKLGRRRRSC